MLSIFKKVTKKAGLPPGTLVHVGEKKVERVKITVIDYNEKDLEEKVLSTVEECFVYKETPNFTWINIDGLHEVEIIQKIGEHFTLHPLVLEDIVHTDQRPKVEDHEHYLFIVSRMLLFEENRNRINSEQCSLILGSNFIITFQEREGDVFEPVRERLRKGKGRIRGTGMDYLAYALVDAIVDNYFIVLEKIGERVESLEEAMTEDPGPETMQMIHHLKRELIILRKSVWPLREVISRLEREGIGMIQKNTTIYFRDVYDHTIQVIETIETFRDMTSGMLDLYLSTISNRMNEVMKILTIIATIFIPLTFIAGIYGMNFKYMPELEWHWGYPVALVVMIVIVILMLIWFRRKRFI